MTHPQILVTLTGTSNPYLQDDLPLVGLLELFEVGLHGRIIKAVFREQVTDEQRADLAAAGKFPPGPVEVKDPVFVYTTHPEPTGGGKPVARLPRAAVAAASRHAARRLPLSASPLDLQCAVLEELHLAEVSG